MTDLETRLAATMRAHGSAAPTPEEVSIRSYRVTTRQWRRGRRTRVWLVAAFSACAVALGGGTTTLLATRDHAAGTSLQSGPGLAPAAIYVVGPASSDGTRPHHKTRSGRWVSDDPGTAPVLEAVDTAAAGGPAGVVRSLFAQPSARGRFNGWAGTRLLDLHRRRGAWVVDVSRAPRPVPVTARPHGMDGSAAVGTVLQQLAWTLSSATRSTLPIRVEVGGRPLTELAGVAIAQDALPQAGYLTDTARTAGWPAQVCGAYLAVGVGGRTHVYGGPSMSTFAPTTVVDMSVGQTLRPLARGLCFGRAGIGVQHRRRTANGRTSIAVLGDSERWRAPRAGRFVLVIQGGGLTCDFVGSACLAYRGGPETYGIVTVHVTG